MSIMKNKLLAYLALYALYLVQTLIGAVLRIQEFLASRKKKNLYIAATLLYAGFIFYLSSQSHISIPTELFKIDLLYDFAHIFQGLGLGIVIDIVEFAHHNFDKVAHVFLYFGLGLLLLLVFRNSDNILLRRYAPLVAFAVGMIYGITDEIHQYFVPGRTASMHDLIANGIGLGLVVLFVMLVFVTHILLDKKKSEQS